ncbi:MAG: hypothetical protein JWP36_2282 [Paucimonas sp.]|nr:hypothetical protein [Paucimonas sp.]
MDGVGKQGFTERNLASAAQQGSAIAPVHARPMAIQRDPVSPADFGMVLVSAPQAARPATAGVPVLTSIAISQPAAPPATQALDAAISAAALGAPCVAPSLDREKSYRSSNLDFLMFRAGIGAGGQATPTVEPAAGSAHPARQFAQQLGERYQHVRLLLLDQGTLPEEFADGLAAAQCWQSLELVVDLKALGPFSALLESLLKKIHLPAGAPKKELCLKFSQIDIDKARAPVELAALRATRHARSPLVVTRLSVAPMTSQALLAGLLHFIRRSPALESLHFACGMDETGRNNVSLFPELMAVLERGCGGLRELALTHFHTVADFDRLAAVLERRPGINRLRLLTTHDGNAKVHGLRLARLLPPHLTSLTLEGLDLKGDNLAACGIALLKTMRLAHLRISQCSFKGDLEPLLAGLTSNQSIRHFEFLDNKVEDRRYEPSRLARSLTYHCALETLEIEYFANAAFRAQLEMMTAEKPELKLVLHGFNGRASDDAAQRHGWTHDEVDADASWSRRPATQAIKKRDSDEDEATVEFDDMDDDDS